MLSLFSPLPLLSLFSIAWVGVSSLLCRSTGEIDKSDLEKLVKEKEATELEAAEKRRVMMILLPVFFVLS